MSRLDPAPTFDSSPAHGLLWRTKTIFRSFVGFFLRLTHFKTLSARCSTLSLIGEKCSDVAPPAVSLTLAPVISGSIIPSNSGMTTDHTSSPPSPCMSSLHSSSVLWYVVMPFMIGTSIRLRTLLSSVWMRKEDWRSIKRSIMGLSSFMKNLSMTVSLPAISNSLFGKSHEKTGMTVRPLSSKAEMSASSTSRSPVTTWLR